MFTSSLYTYAYTFMCHLNTHTHNYQHQTEFLFGFIRRIFRKLSIDDSSFHDQKKDAITNKKLKGNITTDPTDNN